MNDYDMEIEVRIKLAEMRKSQKWLIEEFTKRTGHYMDRSYLLKVLRGRRKADNVKKAICEIVGIKYEC